MYIYMYKLFCSIIIDKIYNQASENKMSSNFYGNYNI